jgi:predicted tellurium resistance membrane protein TerC
MSLDNVLAVAAAAHGDMTLVVFGIALSLPIVVWGSGLLATLMNRFVWIIWLGGGILGYVAGEMILKERHLARWIDHTASGIGLLPLLPAVIIVALGWWYSTQNGRKKVPESA